MKCSQLDILVFICLCFTLGTCSSPDKSSSNVPSHIQVMEGFTVDVVAGPDLVDYPMFGMVDENGRLFLFESTGNVYDKTEDAITNPQFRINLLEDNNDDGVYDKSTIYADSIGFPQGGVLYKGSLYVSSAPDLLKFTDTDGDGVADKKEVLLSGWVLNVNANSLIGPFMAPDGWLYLTSAIEGFDIITKEGEQLKGETSRVWRVKPDGSNLEWISAGGMNNPVGLTFTSASEPIGTMTYFTDPKAGQRDALMYWTEGGVYPKPNSNITRDQLPLTGELMPVVTRYSRVAPVGIFRYRNKFLGEEYQNNMFSAQFNTHRVLLHKLIRDGASFRTEDEVFFSSSNEDFHPTDVLEDGNGSLLIVETGGWFIKGCPLSQVSKPELEGAIYRVRRTDASKVKDPYGNAIDWKTLDHASAADYFEDDRPFVTDKAFNWLIDQGQASVGILAEVLKNSKSVTTRTRSVFALYQIGSTESIDALRSGLDDTDLQVRVAAARAVGLAKDSGSIERLMQMVLNDEPAPRRQAATALGQIGNVKAISTLLKAATGVQDRFIEHAIIYALILINQPEEISKGLNDPSPEVKKAAMIALDQMKNSSLKAEQLTTFLTSNDSTLQHTALWIASHHPEWATEMTSYLKGKFSKGQLNANDEKLLKQILISFCGNASVQTFMAKQLGSTTQANKLFILDAMTACAVENMPESWISQFGNELTAANPVELKLKILKLLRLHGTASLSKQLENLAGNKNNSSVLRIGAIGVLLETDSIITNDHFNYLFDQLQDTNDAPARQQAATVLGQASLTQEHLTKLANYLPNADAFILPRLMPVFKGGMNVEIGKAVTTALSNSPSLDTFTEEYIRTTLAGYPTDVKPLVDQLITKLNDVQKERLARLQGIENRINEGDIERGRILFFGKAICYTCHTIGNEGGNFGPDLTSIQRDRSMHDLVEAVVFPSVSFVREYETYQIKTKENTYSGIIQEQTTDIILLGISPLESVRIRKDEVVSTEIQDVSMMPQGLDQLLTEQEMANLLAFLIGQDQDPETDSDLLR